MSEGHNFWENELQEDPSDEKTNWQTLTDRKAKQQKA